MMIQSLRSLGKSKHQIGKTIPFKRNQIKPQKRRERKQMQGIQIITSKLASCPVYLNQYYLLCPCFENECIFYFYCTIPFTFMNLLNQLNYVFYWIGSDSQALIQASLIYIFSLTLEAYDSLAQLLW
ncbi:hypothetical protein Ddye_023112 [Dipteronia dyeriana]|uniref:Uncharacterized protein n=1 Tax=Dipteronia dyeriana TaxID=168575 RepID=A0AAD9TSD2_9ROSI|nr:hypothetical protein Ddye_023112 [Dipteronia dyeriana]